MKVHLTHPMAGLLREVAAKHKIDVQLLVAEDGSWHLTEKDRDTLIEAISTEFCATGLRQDSEPNHRGFQLEELLDRMNRLL